ncbi:hypothetical protein O181_000185 [Austropuccinia psidii MF-1]|uniref:Uncharacterized protein n=1 Tax=Austropuccinia psidii MF-1 TaxID=1389203 RepID=A0A9Q3B8F4_9BASI|nr:hypothetical protein [Austropuccinia psidii MF-1]
MKFRSEKATTFMCRVDEEIKKTDSANGKLPLDFYNAEWFNSHTPGERTVIADSGNVIFLPDASRSIWGQQHKDEKLNDKNFTQKYWDEMTEGYDLSHEISAEEEDKSKNPDSSDLDTTSEEEAENSDEEQINECDGDGLDSQEIQGIARLDRDTGMAHVDNPGCFAVGVASG